MVYFENHRNFVIIRHNVLANLVQGTLDDDNLFVGMRGA